MTRSSNHVTGTKGRRRLDQVLTIGADLFTDQGYERTTVQDIADAVGISKGSLYYYFTSKEELLFKVLLRNHEHLHRYVVDDVDYSALEGLDSVHTFIARHVDFVLQHSAVSALFDEGSHLVRPVEEWWTALIAARRNHETALIRLIEGAQTDGSASDELDASLSARALLSMANGSRRWSHGAEGARAGIVDHHARLAVRALS